MKKQTAVFMIVLLAGVASAKVTEKIYNHTSTEETGTENATTEGQISDATTFAIPKGVFFGGRCEMVDEESVIVQLIDRRDTKEKTNDFNIDPAKNGIQIWHLKTKVKAAEFPDGSFGLSPNRKNLVIHDNKDQIHTYQIEGAKSVGFNDGNRKTAMAFGGSASITDDGTVVAVRLIPEPEKKDKGVFSGLGIFSTDGTLRKTIQLKSALGFRDVRDSSGNGKKYAVAFPGPPRVNVVDLESEKIEELEKLKNEWKAAPKSVQLSPDGRYLAVVTDRLILVDLETKSIVFQHTPLHNGTSTPPSGTIFSQDSKRLAWVSEAGGEWIDLPPEEKVVPHAAPGIQGPNCIAFSPSGKRLLGRGETDGKPDFSKLRILDLPTKKQ